MGRSARGEPKPEPIKAALSRKLFERFHEVWENEEGASQMTRQDFAAFLISLGLRAYERKIKEDGIDPGDIEDAPKGEPHNDEKAQ